MNIRRVEESVSGEEPTMEEDIAAIPETEQIQYSLHLASYRNLDKVSDGWAELQTKYPEILADKTARISILDIQSFGGVYYRLKAGPIEDKAEADRLCSRFQAAGEYCVVAEFSGAPLD